MVCPGSFTAASSAVEYLIVDDANDQLIAVMDEGDGAAVQKMRFRPAGLTGDSCPVYLETGMSGSYQAASEDGSTPEVNTCVTHHTAVSTSCPSAPTQTSSPVTSPASPVSSPSSSPGSVSACPV